MIVVNPVRADGSRDIVHVMVWMSWVRIASISGVRFSIFLNEAFMIFFADPDAHVVDNRLRKFGYRVRCQHGEKTVPPPGEKEQRDQRVRVFQAGLDPQVDHRHDAGKSGTGKDAGDSRDEEIGQRCSYQHQYEFHIIFLFLGDRSYGIPYKGAGRFLSIRIVNRFSVRF